MAVRREFVEGLYRDLLNRGDNFTPGEVEGWLGAPDEDSVRQMFLGSSEYTGAHGGEATWKDVGGQITPTNPILGDAGGGAPDYHGYDGGGDNIDAPSRTTGFTPRYDYSAFNTGREQDPDQSAKDAFALISNQAPPPPFQDKRQMANWFNQYVRPGMDALGHAVSSVSEDGFTYSNHEGTFFVDFGQNSGATPGSMLQRLQWNATPADAATRAKYATSGGGTPVPGGATTRRSGDVQALGGITNGPLQEVGQDPFSELITGSLADLIQRGGSSEFGDLVKSSLTDYMRGSGSTNARYESARELANKARRSMISDSRASLADRGLLSEPGAPSGIEAGVLRSINQDVSEEFARTVRDIAADQDDRILPVLQIATSMSQAETGNLLSALGQGTQRQTALAQIALQQLSQNMAWNQFLAEFGLERDQALAMLQNGQTDDLMGLMNLFLSMGSLLRGGYV